MTSPQRKTPVPDTVSPPPHSDQQWQLQSELGSLLMSNKLICSFIVLLRVEKQNNGLPLLQSLYSPKYSSKHFTTVWEISFFFFQNWHAGILLVFLSLLNFWLRKTIYWVFSVVMILHTCWGHRVCFHTVTKQCSLNIKNTNNANIIIWHILKLILVVIHASYQFKNLIFFSEIGVDFNQDVKTFNLIVRFWVIALPAGILPSFSYAA